MRISVSQIATHASSPRPITSHVVLWPNSAAIPPDATAMSESVRKVSGSSFFRRKTKDRSASQQSEVAIRSNNQASYSLPDLGVEKFSIDYGGVALTSAHDDDEPSAESSWQLIDPPSRLKSGVDRGSEAQFHRLTLMADSLGRGRRAPLPSEFTKSVLDQPIIMRTTASRARKKLNQLNVMVTGSCGSGKTSLANLLLNVHEHDRLQEHLVGTQVRATKSPAAAFAIVPTSHFEEKSIELSLTSPYASSGGRVGRYSTVIRSSKRETRLQLTVIDTPGLTVDDPLELERGLKGLTRLINSRLEQALVAETSIQRQPSNHNERLVHLGECRPSSAELG